MGRCFCRGRISPSHCVEYVGESGRVAAGGGRDGTLSHGDCLSDASGAGDGVAQSAGGEDPLQGAADHGVSESIYLNDPDENGVELYCDKPKEKWPRSADGKLEMYTRRLDLHELLKEAPEGSEMESGPRICSGKRLKAGLGS